MDSYKLLMAKLKVEHAANELKIALTHKSFYKNGGETKDNSRYVFAGMFAFKGLVAKAMYEFVPATGTQLQHALGNLFKNEHLERLFAYYELDKHIRYSKDFDADSHRHIFVFGMLGYMLVHAGEQILRNFISRHFILLHTDILMPQTKSRDMESQCRLLAGVLDNSKIKAVMRQDGTLWTTTVFAGNERTLAEESSVSYRYSKQKALKRALIVLTEAINEKDRLSNDYEVRRQRAENKILQKQEAEKQRKHQAQIENQEKKKAEHARHKAEQKAKTAERDRKRREAKAAIKLRKEEQARRAAEIAAKMANMSANKRRHLQDKGQLK